jgi:hypothetical protein
MLLWRLAMGNLIGGKKKYPVMDLSGDNPNKNMALGIMQDLKKSQEAVKETPVLEDWTSDINDDENDIRNIFIRKTRKSIQTHMRRGMFLRIENYGLSSFFDAAVASFDGTIKDLLEAAARLEFHRNDPAFADEELCQAHGRIRPELYEKFQAFHKAAQGSKIKRISKAKIAAGFAMAYLEKLKAPRIVNEVPQEPAEDTSSEKEVLQESSEITDLTVISEGTTSDND